MDLERIQELLRLMEANRLEEIEIEDKDSRVRLKKESKAIAATVAAGVPVAAVASSPDAGPAVPASGAAGVGAEELPGNCRTISSPIVGSFYRAPSPDGEPFVDVGDPVDADTVVCIVEAMKVMNEVRAEATGTVEKVLVENGAAVEYGQPLFLVTKP